ncbi:Protein PTHB1 [Chelonia mydas]|uniref:Protein PTHB1 n=1 Tax=Chelonia mydas TaxID=8469 RepID=M7B384_CHEMY|nr:Protein PTHB1 [Chelonia mydas]
MSLFKARDWWSTALGEKEEFDQGCLCVADVDNSGNGQDKIIVGSYIGYLRIFNPHPVKPGDGMQAEDLLLEVQLRDSILQVEVGKFVSYCTDAAMSYGTLGNVEHGNQYQIKLMYEHNLQRTACNMTYGPFGGVKGRDLICIQSMDGMLMLFEQESYAFGRFLPGFLLPGPLTYSSRTDSFITVSSCQQVESYNLLPTVGEGEKTYLVLANLVMDWVLNIGEQALDICVVSFNQTSSVFVLGERNFFCLKDNGQIRFMKKLDCSPSCFLPYCSVSEGTINTLVGNHNNMLHVYQDVTLKWATQLPHIPVAVKVGNLQDLKGVIVTLSDSGHLQCSYLGTDPSLFQAPKVESREINYEELDREMKELQKIIKESTKTQDILPKSEKDYDDLRITAEVSPDLDVDSQAIDSEVRAEAVPSVTVKRERGYVEGHSEPLWLAKSSRKRGTHGDKDRALSQDVFIDSTWGCPYNYPALCVDSINGLSRNSDADFGDEEDEEEVEAQQASGETVFSHSQELFFTLDLVPSQATEGGLPDLEGGEGTSGIGISTQNSSGQRRLRELWDSYPQCNAPEVDTSPESCGSKAVALSVFLKGNCPPAELEGDAVASYSTPTGIPRVAQCKFRLPLRLICFPAQPSKTANHKLTIDTNKPPVSLVNLFPDFADQSDEDQVNVLGFQFLTGSRITLLASKTSQRYRIQSEQLEDLWLITKELAFRLEEHFKKQNSKDFTCTFSGSVPLQEYFELIDRHFELRLNAEKFEELLSERAIQFRAIERRLLTRFKDKTPAPLQHLDTLLEGTYRQNICHGTEEWWPDSAYSEVNGKTPIDFRGLWMKP